jgi:hypothetical protein
MPDYGLDCPGLFGRPLRIPIERPWGNDFVVANPAYPQRVDVARQDLASNRFRGLSHYSPLTLENRAHARNSV